MVGQVEIVPRHMVELTTRICAELGYQGIAEFEFKRDERSGEFYLIEINPRSWSWIGITPACGVSLPWIAYTDLTQPGTVEFAESRAATGSVKWVRPLDDLANVMLYNRRTGFPEWSLGPLGWWRSIRSGDVIYAGFAKDDPGAALHTTAAQVKRLARSAFRWRK
jgi:hypothetical protein